MARFEYVVCCVALIVVISFTVVLANSEFGIHLAHRCVAIYPSPANKLPVIMLHGLTGAKESWDGIYQVIPFLTGRRVCVYDARNHGDSGWNDTFTVDALVEDLEHFMTQLQIARAALVGHSLGGLTIMKFALKNPEKVESIFVEDISPKKIPKGADDHFKTTFKVLLDSLSSIPPDADEETAKKAVIDYFTKVTKSPLPEGFFKKSRFRCKNGVWQWKENFEVFLKSMDDMGSFVGKMEGQYDGRSFFIYGEKSPFKVFEDKEYIIKLFPNTEFFEVEGADHVVHSNTTVYLSKLVKFLKRSNL